MTKTQLDRIGDRIRKGNISDEDLRLVDQYRRTFEDSYEIVVGAIRNKLSLKPTGRPAKSTTSIADKLRRESIRLSQIQDMAGCRVIVVDIAEQESVVESLQNIFEGSSVVDRRELPSNGYRAIHVIVKIGERMIEVQVRTLLQHLWAELSEKLSDIADPAIKYGGGSENVRTLLANASALVVDQEMREIDFAKLVSQISIIEKSGGEIEKINESIDKMKEVLASLKQSIDRLRKTIFNGLREAIEKFSNAVGDTNDFSD
jgi:putative GTP pyrophosphokinase